MLQKKVAAGGVGSAGKKEIGNGVQAFRFNSETEELKLVGAYDLVDRLATSVFYSKWVFLFCSISFFFTNRPGLFF